MKQNIRLSLIWMVSFSALIFISSCGDDDPEPVLSDPVLSLDGDATMVAKPGQAIEVDLTIDAEGGLSSIIVNRDGGFLEEIEITDPEATTFSYTGQTVPGEANEGATITYSFVGVNTQDKESESVDFEISVALYDMVSSSTVGDVFNVTIPTDGLVTDGTSILLAQGRSYYIGSSLVFESGSGLTIEEGVVVYLNANAEDAVGLEVGAGVAVSIAGTATAPVVMTSSKVMVGETPEPGDWDNLEIEATSNSTLKYVRMEYGGDRVFRLRNMDDSNDISYINVFKSEDEGIMVTDGNVNMKYLVATQTGDSNFRLGDEYSGSIQFAIAWNSEDGGEAFYLRESSDVTLANVTVVGPGKETINPPTEYGNSGIRFRSSVGGKVYNAVITGLPDWAVRAQEVTPTDIDGPVVFAYSHVYDNDSRDDDDADIFFTEGGFANSEDAIDGITTGSIIPASTASSDFDPSSLGSFFTSATFKGAIENAANDWTTGWVKNPDGTVR